MVTVGSGDRIHFQDWGGSRGGTLPLETPPVDRDGVLLIHGLSQTALIWAPVARRLAAEVPTVAMDLRGHGLSDAPTEPGSYDLDVLAADVVAVAEGSGLLDPPRQAVVLAGHGFGAIVAATAAVALGTRCLGLVLVDGGWESMEAALGMEADEFLRTLEEPPEVMRSMRAFLADRKSFDPATWDDDQEAAARAAVVETRAGRVVPATRPHALEGCVRAMFQYDPAAALTAVAAPVLALVAGEDDDGRRTGALVAASTTRVAAGRGAIRSLSLGPVGHNLMRYRPTDVAAAVRSLDAGPAPRPSSTS